MRITFVCPPLNMSGGIRVVQIYADALRSFGHEVLVVTPSLPSKTRFARIWRRLGLPPLAARTRKATHFDRSSTPRRVLRSTRPVRNADVPDADAVVATWWETADWVHRFSPSKGRKFYFVQHHEVFDRNRAMQASVEASYRLPLRKIVIAEWLRRVMATRYDDSSSLLVPNAVDRSQFHAPARVKQSVPTIGTLFNEADFKAFDITLQVLAEVRRRIGEVRVLSFGTLKPNKYAGQLDGIDLVVNPPQDTIRSTYAQCDLWLSCSRSEGFNLTAMEAMACRTPVVSTRTGWPEEAIHGGVNGALADVDDVAGLADGVVSILQLPPDEWVKLSEGAYLTVESSDWEASARLFEQALMSPDRATN